MKRMSLILFLVVFIVFCILAGYYFYVSGILQNTIDIIFDDKITITSENPDIEIKIIDRKKFESYLVKYDILGNNKYLVLQNDPTIKGNVRQIRINIVQTNINYRDIYSASDSSVIAYSYLPEFKNSQIKLNLYINPDWLKFLPVEQQSDYLLETIIESLYLTTHKTILSKTDETREKIALIYNEIILERPKLLELKIN